MSQDDVARKIGVSWNMIHRWELSKSMIPEDTLGQLGELYDKPLSWFLTLEKGDIECMTGSNDRQASDATDRVAASLLAGKIAGAPADIRPIIMTVVEDILDGLTPAD
jgi:transcriptional regulator with XRE-family HTH domain